MSAPRTIRISIRDFALPVPRLGSIEAHSGYGRALEGAEIHLAVQARRADADATYRAEVPLSRTFTRGEYEFVIGGRMDGLFLPEVGAPRIEEIKTTFSVPELKRRLEEGALTHPYNLQLLTYGYFYRLEHGVDPELTFHLVSTRGQGSDDLELLLDVDAYEAWLETRLDELAAEVARAEKRAARRRKLVRKFAFPFETPRAGQRELIATIEEGMREQKRMLIQAPTGLGKTVGVLYPSLKEALARAQRVVYVTPKNSQHSVAEDAIERFQDTGTAVRSLTITAKSKICFQNEPVCNPDRCEYARDYYKKVHEHELVQKLAKKKRLRTKNFREIGEEYQVCPFELQIDAADDADVVICDYNYVFAPRGVLGKLTEAGQISGVDQEGKPNLVIDEAHNLPGRAMDYYSPAVSTVVLERMRPELCELPAMFRGDAERILDECIGVVAACRPEAPGPAPIPAPAATFRAQDERVRGLVSRYLESAYEIQPRDVILGLGYYWSAFTDALEFAEDPTRSEFFTTFQPNPSGGTVKITCCDASPMLETCYDGYEQVVGFSATLKPFDYYARLSGLLPAESTEPDDADKTSDTPTRLQTSEFSSPFPAGNRKLLIIPQVSTKYSERARNYGKIAAGIARIAAVRPGNYFAFFPSFDFLTQVLAHFEAPLNFEVLQQTREMRAAQVEAVIERLRQPERPAIVFAVQGGVFSEGVDYPGEVVIGAFVVGPPLPNFDLEREQMRQYYEREYGAGFDYAYAFPAMAKAVQAAGRVIRSETDRGLIVFMDSRFLQPSYSKSMPSGWFTEHPRELVSTRILDEVREFWG